MSMELHNREDYACGKLTSVSRIVENALITDSDAEVSFHSFGTLLGGRRKFSNVG